LPLQDFLFESEGKRFINFSFGSPINDLVIDNIIVKVSSVENVSYKNVFFTGLDFVFLLQVVLPEGSNDIFTSTPFPAKQGQEVL